MTRKRYSDAVQRRRLLSATGGVLGTTVFGVNAVNASTESTDHDAHGHDDDNRIGVDEEGGLFHGCPESTIAPSMGHCTGASMGGCHDDDPVTISLQTQSREAIESQYSSIGALLEQSFLPYFDVKRPGFRDGWSHWLQPEYLGDDVLLDPERPESILVDNRTWQPIGIMFIATVDGDPIDPPPPVYDRTESNGAEHDQHSYIDVSEFDGDVHENDGVESGEHAGDDHEQDDIDDPGDRCSPWHYHAGLPGRLAWWYYRSVYDDDASNALDRSIPRGTDIPCRTPCMMHVWTISHPEGVYAHDAPPSEYRDVEPSSDPGFETDAEPGVDPLDWTVLPDEYVPARRPADIFDRFGVLD